VKSFTGGAADNIRFSVGRAHMSGARLTSKPKILNEYDEVDSENGENINQNILSASSSTRPFASDKSMKPPMPPATLEMSKELHATTLVDQASMESKGK
jgi:hypothetical protein